MQKSNIEYRLKPQGPVLAAYMHDRSRFSCIIGPLGSGKTVQTCQKLFKLMCEQEPDKEGIRKSRWIAIRNTYGDLITTTIKDWIELFGELGRYKAGGMAPPSHTLAFKLDDGTRVESELIFLALDREDSIKKLRGTQVTGFWFNELKELAKSILDMADLRHGRYPADPTWHGIIADTNAPDEDHWLYTLAEITKPKDWAFFIQKGGVLKDSVNSMGKVKWVPNPEAENLQNLPKDYYIKGMQGKSDDWIAVNLGNLYGFVSDGKAIYPQYNDMLHCNEFEFMPNIPIYRGWDFGIPACVLIQYTPAGQLVIRKEYTTKQTMGIDKFADHILNECAPLRNKGFKFIDVGDPAGMQSSQQKDEVTCFKILWEKGIEVEPGRQDVTARLEAVRYFLNGLIDGQAAFVLHPECIQLRKGFQGAYCFRRIQVAGEKYSDKPDKNKFSHPQDAVQYVATYIRQGYEDEAYYDDSYEYAAETDDTGY